MEALLFCGMILAINLTWVLNEVMNINLSVYSQTWKHTHTQTHTQLIHIWFMSSVCMTTSPFMTHMYDSKTII